MDELTDLLSQQLRAEYDGNFAALFLAWSNGSVGKQVNRLKLTKRQMYRQDIFDLLQVCVTKVGKN